jgi:hypothetical protein
MKNMFKIRILINKVAIMAGVLAIATIPVLAQSPAYVSAINGSFVVIPFAASGTSTNYTTSTATNIEYTKYWVQTNTTTYPYQSYYSPVWAFGNPFTDIQLWANRDGTVPIVAFNITAMGPAITNGLSTNILTVTLSTLNYQKGNGGDASGVDRLPNLVNEPSVLTSGALNTFSFILTNTYATTNAVIAYGTNAAVGYDLISMSTNLPTSFLQGALALRMTITSGPQGLNTGLPQTNYSGSWISTNNAWSQTNIFTGWQIINAGLTGFKPVGGQ